ncbi:hypothetical protein [Sphingomonas sp. HMP6]|uniref:hypothetical protein n=1 Tax=Sphingomonas sp. HMP6 TaxID=1517551 RepID=UPI001596A65F|nr:hypothetical protein [Sphingomonas sp. HMP6]
MPNAIEFEQAAIRKARFDRRTKSVVRRARDNPLSAEQEGLIDQKGLSTVFNAATDPILPTAPLFTAAIDRLAVHSSYNASVTTELDGMSNEMGPELAAIRAEIAPY